LNKSLLPPNSTPLERAVERVAIDAIDAIELPHRDLWNPDTCPIELLPWLALTVVVEGWRADWPEHIKRARVKAALDIQRTKGTVYSVRRVVESFGGQIAIREWWQTTPKGVPHTFELVLTLSGNGGTDASAEFVADVIAEVNRTKPLRSHFTFIQGLQTDARITLVAAGRAVAYARLDMTIH
jgi:phage tail P2-like protein